MTRQGLLTTPADGRGGKSSAIALSAIRGEERRISAFAAAPIRKSRKRRHDRRQNIPLTNDPVDFTGKQNFIPLLEG
jgi:hypothetical protein